MPQPASPPGAQTTTQLTSLLARRNLNWRKKFRLIGKILAGLVCGAIKDASFANDGLCALLFMEEPGQYALEIKCFDNHFVIFSNQ